MAALLLAQFFRISNYQSVHDNSALKKRMELHHTYPLNNLETMCIPHSPSKPRISIQTPVSSYTLHKLLNHPSLGKSPQLRCTRTCLLRNGNCAQCLDTTSQKRHTLDVTVCQSKSNLLYNTTNIPHGPERVETPSLYKFHISVVMRDEKLHGI